MTITNNHARDVIASVVHDVLNASGVGGKRWRLSVSGIIANRLIAAGVTVVAPCTRWAGCTLHDGHDGRCFVR